MNIHIHCTSEDEESKDALPRNQVNNPKPRTQMSDKQSGYLRMSFPHTTPRNLIAMYAVVLHLKSFSFPGVSEH